MKNLWAEVGVSGWTTLLRKANCLGVSTVSSEDIQVCCPYHNEATPSFRLRVSKGYIKCFGCGKFESNPIKFVADILTSGSYTQALSELRSVGLRSISEKDSKKLKEDEIKQKVYNEVAYVCNKHLVDSCANYSGDTKQPETKTIDYLLSRGIPVLDENFDVSSLPIGLLPSKDLYTKYKLTEPERVHDFFSGWLEDGLATFKGGLVFFYYSTPTELSGFRIRYEFLNPKRWTEKQIKSIGPKDSSIGFFGLNTFCGQLGNSRIKTDALVVEGEFDLLAQQVNYIKSGIGYDPILCTKGGGLSSLDSAASFGIDNLYLALDNYNVDSAGLPLLMGVLKNTSIKSYVFNWPFRQKDPAEVIETIGWEQWRDVIIAKDHKGQRVNFTSTPEFLFQQFRYKVELPVTDLRRSLEDATDLGACLKNEADRRDYTSKVCELLEVPRGMLLGNICSREDTEEGFIQRCANELRSTYEFIGKSETSGKTVVTLWLKNKRRLKTIETTKGATEFISSISMDLGAPIEWARRTVGVPDFISFQGSGKARSETSFVKQNSLIKSYLEITMNSILSTLPATQQLHELGQGAHFVDIGDAGDKKDAWVILNGDSAYLGTWKDNKLHFRVITEPRIGKYYFNLDPTKKWSEELKSVEDLNYYYRDQEVTSIKECYDWLVDHLDKCWVMEEGYHGMQYLAAAIVLTCINSIMPRQLYTIINGKANTGKSAFMNLIGAGDDPKYRILECVYSSDTYSAAGFMQEMSNRTGARAFDEFEISAKEPKKTAAVNTILGYLRGLINKRYHKIVQGTQSGRSVEYVIKCCIWACSIESLQQPADISRFVRFRTVPVEGKMKQEAYILNHVGFDVITKFRRFLTLGLYGLAKDYIKIQERLYSEYLSGISSEGLSSLKKFMGEGSHVPSRLLEAALLTGSVVELAGGDPYNYIVNFCKSQSDNISEIAESSASQELVSDILSSKVTISLPGIDTRITTIRSLLSDASDRTLLNDADCGIRYVEVEDKKRKSTNYWLIFMWPELLNILRENKSQLYKKDTPSRLKNRLAPDSNTVKIPTASKRLGKLKPYLKVGIRRSDISVYDITSIIEEWETNV